MTDEPKNTTQNTLTPDSSPTTDSELVETPPDAPEAPGDGFTLVITFS